MRKKETKRAINFDLDTKELLKHFKNTHQAYSAIKVFMEDNGFEHRQYSGYVSREPISEFSAISVTEKLNQKFKWLKDCIQKYDVTEISLSFPPPRIMYIQITAKILAAEILSISI